MTEYLDLLAELGIEIPAEAWEAEHPRSPSPEPAILPWRPDHRDANGMAVFTQSQMDWCDPTCYGFDEPFEIVEDDAAAKPYVLSWDDEQYYRANYNRAVHRYSRIYRLRWTLSHVVGDVGKLPEDVERWLRSALALEPQPHVIHTRRAHEWVRGKLKERRLTELYISTPFIVRLLGGPRWRVHPTQYGAVLDAAVRTHRTFEALRKRRAVGRQRFPKMQYVLLKLLDRHGVMHPYRVPWARTAIKRRQLGALLRDMDADGGLQA